jgi:nucleotide-binding universal stress UspA family protein
MFLKILIPVDLADRHEPSLEIAARLATPGAGEVTVLHVIELLRDLPREADPKFYQRLEDKSRARLDVFAASLKDKGVSARPIVVYGERVREVLRYATQEAVDLIVLTSHPVEPDEPGGGLGTMSYLIGIAARCPVMLVKAKPEP